MRLLDRLIVSVTNALRRLPCFGRNLHCLRCNSRVHRPLNLNSRSSTYYDDKAAPAKKAKHYMSSKTSQRLAASPVRLRRTATKRKSLRQKLRVSRENG